MLIMFVSVDQAFHPPSFYKGDQISCLHSTAGKRGKGKEKKGEEKGAHNVSESEPMP